MGNRHQVQLSAATKGSCDGVKAGGERVRTKAPDPRMRELWKSYKQTGDVVLRNRLMEHYLPLVKSTAERVHRKLPHSVDVDDLASAGVFGLRDAIEGFDLSHGVKFETYCATRVRGAMLDELRSVDWVPRLVRTRATKLERTVRKLEVDLGRQPTDRELAGNLGVSLEQLDDVVRGATAVSIVSLSENWTGEDESSPVSKLEVLADRSQERPSDQLERKDILASIAKVLTMKERLIVLLYYFEGMTMRDIGLTLSLSESRVCQLHTRIMDRLREQLGKHKVDLLAR